MGVNKRAMRLVFAAIDHVDADCEMEDFNRELGLRGDWGNCEKHRQFFAPGESCTECARLDRRRRAALLGSNAYSVPKVEVPRGAINLRRAPVIPSYPMIYKPTLPYVWVGVALCWAEVLNRWLIFDAVLFLIQVACACAIFMLVTAGLQIRARQQSKYVQWENDGHLPREVAEELRTWRLGKALVDLDVKPLCALEELTEEAVLWKISYPSLSIADNGRITLGKRLGAAKPPPSNSKNVVYR